MANPPRKIANFTYPLPLSTARSDLGLSNYFGNNADYHSAYPSQERFPIKRPGCKGLKLSEPSSTRYFAPITRLTRCRLLRVGPIGCASLGYRRPHSTLSLAHGK